MARRNWSPGPNLAADQLLRDRPTNNYINFCESIILQRSLHNPSGGVLSLEDYD